MNVIKRTIIASGLIGIIGTAIFVVDADAGDFQNYVAETNALASTLTNKARSCDWDVSVHKTTKSDDCLRVQELYNDLLEEINNIQTYMEYSMDDEDNAYFDRNKYKIKKLERNVDRATDKAIEVMKMIELN